MDGRLWFLPAMNAQRPVEIRCWPRATLRILVKLRDSGTSIRERQRSRPFFGWMDTSLPIGDCLRYGRFHRRLCQFNPCEPGNVGLCSPAIRMLRYRGQVFSPVPGVGLRCVPDSAASRERIRPQELCLLDTRLALPFINGIGLSESTFLTWILGWYHLYAGRKQCQ